jgi:hypothetical protein
MIEQQQNGKPTACECPTHPGRAIADEIRHLAFHKLVIAQGGPGGLVNHVTLREARGFRTATVTGETILDQRARDSGKRASGALRRASR